MAVSETIQEILQGIDDAQYGRDMRDYIHKGIQKCYEEGSAGETDLVARQAIEEMTESVDDVYLMPCDSTISVTGLKVLCDPIVFPAHKMMMINVLARNTTNSDITNISSLRGVVKNLPIPLFPEQVYPMLYWKQTTDFPYSVNAYCTISRHIPSGETDATEGRLAIMGKFAASSLSRCTIAVPYSQLSDTYPLTSGTLIDPLSYDWDYTNRLDS